MRGSVHPPCGVRRPEGRPLPFLDWASAASDKKQRFDRLPKSSERPTEVERRGIDVAHRLATYQAYSGDRLSTAGVVLIMPRPSDAKYLAFTAEAIKEARARENAEGMPPMKLDALGAIATYWNLIPNDDKKDPTEDPKADAKFSKWLRDSSVWVPLKTFLKAKPEELVAAGYPEGTVKSFLDAYRELEKAEAGKPGAIDEPVATKLLAASRSLGESVSPQYPSAALIERETRFNALNPFLIAPFSYGTALLILVLTLVCLKATTPASPFQTVGRGAYWLRAGHSTLVGGMAVGDFYGFYLRIRISGWAPVTNMYETVIWVALVAAVLSLVFELIFRQVFVAPPGGVGRGGCSAR